MTFNQRNIDFDTIRLPRWSPVRLNRDKNHPVHAFDTETYHGYARLLCDDRGRWIINPDLTEILRWLTPKSWRNTQVFCYNLRFDAEGILKMLPDENLAELHETNRTDYEDWKIKYLPEKMLGIRDRHHNNVKIFDIAQFYETSLDTAGKNVLGEGKVEVDFRAALNTDKNIWHDRQKEIIEYCKQDAALTARLAYYLQQKLKSFINFCPQSFFSKADVAKQFLRRECELPRVRKVAPAVLKYAFNAYKGGRFETFRKGTFENVYNYDITSAYPYEIAELIDITRGKWKPYVKGSPRGHYGFYACSVDIPPCRISPIAYYGPTGVLIYPVGQFKTYLTKQEIDAYSPYVDIKIFSGWEFFPKELVYPFKDYINRLFKLKQQTDKKDFVYLLIKIMLNSIYGAFYEKHPEQDHLKAGKLFNPIYASLITANTRIKLFKAVADHEDDIIGFATDGILSTAALDLPLTLDLGDWKLDRADSATIIRSGIYRFGDEVKSRGIMNAGLTGSRKVLNTDKGEYQDIFDYFLHNPDDLKVTLHIQRPRHLNEAISRKDTTKADANIWFDDTRTLSLNGSQKRIFISEFTKGSDLFERNIESVPMIIRPKD